MPKEYKLKLFDFLNNMGKNNGKFYSTLTDDQKKEVQPFVMMRWLTGTKDAYQIYMLNELVNPFVFALGHHKELLVNLMTLCGSGRNQRYSFIKVKSKKNTKMPKVIAVIKEYFGYSTLDALDALPLISTDDVVGMAEDLGIQKKEITVIKRELRTR